MTTGRNIQARTGTGVPFGVRYLPDRWQAGLTMNGKSDRYKTPSVFTLRGKDETEDDWQIDHARDLHQCTQGRTLFSPSPKKGVCIT